MCPNLSGGPYSTVPDGYLYDSISGCVFDSSYNTPQNRQAISVRISMSLTVQCHIFLRGLRMILMGIALSHYRTFVRTSLVINTSVSCRNDCCE